MTRCAYCRYRIDFVNNDQMLHFCHRGPPNSIERENMLHTTFPAVNPGNKNFWCASGKFSLIRWLRWIRR